MKSINYQAQTLEKDIILEIQLCLGYYKKVEQRNFCI